MKIVGKEECEISGGVNGLTGNCVTTSAKDLTVYLAGGSTAALTA
jgi:hypothetical protein